MRIASAIVRGLTTLCESEERANARRAIVIFCCVCHDLVVCEDLERSKKRPNF